MDELVIAHRFRGPTGSGNGGWTAGALAEVSGLAGPVAVTLRRPPPLDTRLRVHQDGQTYRLLDGVDVVAEAGPGSDPTVVEVVDPEAARAAESAYAGLDRHPFPECFVCGPARAAGDGLRLFPGPVGEGRTACTWTPQDTGAQFVWAALDCPSAWTAADLAGRPLVLGRITASIHRVPEAGEPLVVVGRNRGEEGRKTWTSSTIWGRDADMVGVADHTWIAVDPSVFDAGQSESGQGAGSRES